MKKATPKKKAPVQLTAGTGFRNENCIAARFLLDLLARTDRLGADFGKIDRLQWQGRDLGWLADDLVVECTAPTGKRSAGISIKSDRQVTSSGFPPDFAGIAWAQWFGVKTERVLRGSNDAIVLMVGSLAHVLAFTRNPQQRSEAHRPLPVRVFLLEGRAPNRQPHSPSSPTGPLEPTRG